MRFEFTALPWELLGRRPAMITLTYPGLWQPYVPDSRTLHRHHRRGADIAVAFYSDEAGDTADRLKVAEYFWRESGKWAQKEPPPDFGSLKFYGRWGQKVGFNPVVTTQEFDERVGIEVRRMMRTLMRNKMQESAARTGRKLPRGAGMPRGRDGLTVFGIDGTVIGPPLVACAEALVVEKLAQAALLPARKRSTSRPARALSERPPAKPPSRYVVMRVVASYEPEDPWGDYIDELAREEEERHDAMIDAFLSELQQQEDERDAWIEDELQRRESAASLRQAQART
jgi:hypothetical protein